MTVSEEARSLLRRHSSGSSDASSVRSSDNKVVTYYQRMRERNNEASKRCRLKRRMKAVSMENQSSMLSMANKMLKLRIMRLENVGAALKEGVKKIQAGHNCDCDLTVNLVRQMSRDYMDKDPMNGKILPSFELISKSKTIRDQQTVQEQNIEMSSSPGLSPTPMMIPSTHAHMASSSEDDIAASPPVENIMPPQPIMLLPKPPSSRVYKTALDVINETIVKTLDSPHPESNPSAALNLVKQQQSAQQQPKQLILVAPSPRPSIESIVSSNGDHHGGSRHSHSARSSPALTTSSSATSSLIKLEHPEVDSSTNNTSSSSLTTTTTTILHQNSSSNTNFRSSAADELPVCIANPDGASMCRGDMLNLNKLTCYLDLITRKVVKDDGASAMERAIIKSRMKIPFWSADETALVICGAHRNSIVHGVDLNVCALCNKKRNGKKPRLAPIHMFTITYRMSLEYYTRNGIILPIGLAVCGLCRDKHLRSVDLSNSRIIPSISPEIIVPDSNTSPVSSVILPTKRELSTSPNSPELLSLNITNNACPAAPAPLPKMRQLSTSSSKVTSTNGDVQVQLVAMSPPQDRIKLDSIKSVVPVSSSQTNAGANIFSKIANLNEALQAINPRYQPIGFSITSMESCSPSVLQDAVSAAETAVFTIMSVIAPGQENHLWEAIRPNLDKKLCKK